MGNHSWIGQEMKQAHQMLEDEKKIVPIRAGLKVSYEDNGDWLSPLPVETGFISKHKNSWSFRADEFLIKGKEKGLTLLLEQKKTGEQDLTEWYWVINVDFCNENKRIVIL